MSSVTLPMGRHNMKEAAVLTLDSAEGQVFLAHSSGVLRLFRDESSSWKAGHS